MSGTSLLKKPILPYDYEVECLLAVPENGRMPETKLTPAQLRLDVDAIHYVTWEGKALREATSGEVFIVGLNDGFTHYVRFNSLNIGNYGISIEPIVPNKAYDIRMRIDNTQIVVGTTLGLEFVEANYTGYQGNSTNVSIKYGNYQNVAVIYIYPNRWYQNDVLIADIITVVKDGVAGFYDKISGEFFAHTGSIAWTAGRRIS